MNKIVKWIVVRKIKQWTKAIRENEMKERNGIFTSEFLISIITVLITMFSEQLGIDPDIQKGIIGLVITYIGSRTAVKAVDLHKNGKNKGGETK